MRIEEYTAQELFELLNELDETVCAFLDKDGGTVAEWDDFLSAA